MGRAKIAMELIDNAKKRKISFNTRKDGLIKKARELATLCDVNVAMIIYSDDQEIITPEIFPSDTEKVKSLIDSYKRNRSTDPARISRYTLKEFYTDRKIKIEEDLVKTKKKNLEAKYPTWFDFLNNYSEAGLRELALGLESKIADVQTRINDQSVNKISDIQINVDPYALYYPILDLTVNPNLTSSFYPSLQDDNNNNVIMKSRNPNFTSSFYPNPLPDHMMLNQDDNNLIMKSRNPNLMSSFYPNSLMLSEDDDNNMMGNPDLITPIMERPSLMLNEDDDNVIIQSGNPSLMEPTTSNSLMLSEDDENVMMQSGNPNSSVYPNWLLDMMLNEDDDNNVIYDDENFSIQSPLMENSFRLSSSIMGYSCEIVN